MTKFKTKIVQRFVNGHEFHELLLPDGQRVASGSLSHCWDEREQWERVLNMECQREHDRRHSEGLQLELKFQ